jgi:Flavin-binding monooxygenase-like
VLHSLEYQNAAPFQGKRVVCVGLGESGADVCHQVVQVAERATLVTRHPPVILPRYWTHWFGKADTIDASNCRVGNLIFSEDRMLGEEVYKFINPLAPLRTPFHAESAFMYEWHKMTNHVFGHFPVKNDVFVQDILAEKLSYNLFGVEEVGPDYVICGDGQRIAADVIIFNTGYQLDLSHFANIPAIKAIDNNVRRLYKHMIHPALGRSLAFIGFIRPDAGGVPACAELQARYWAQLCSGKASLPARATLQGRIDADAQRETRSFYRMPERSTLVRYQRLTDELAALTGCAPRPPLTDPDLLLRYYFGSPVSAWFRLRGPGSDPAAAKAVLRRLPIYFSPLVRVGLVVAATLMALAARIDQFTWGRLGRWIAQRRPQPMTFLQQAVNQPTIDPTVTVRSLCANGHRWQDLKYKFHSTYGLNPKALHTELTVAQLITLCSAEAQAPNALELRAQLFTSSHF